MSTIKRGRSIVTMATAYADQSDPAEDAEEAPEEQEEFVIPEDLSSLADAELEALHAQAIGYFETLYTTEGLNDDALADLATLTDGIETLASETARRQELASQRQDKAAALAARIGFSADSTPEDEPEPEPEPEPEEEPEPEPVEDEAVLASAKRKAIRIPLGNGRRPLAASGGGTRAPERPSKSGTMSEVVFAASPDNGYATGEGMEMMDLALAVDKRLGGFNESVYASANKRGQSMRERGPIALMRKPFEQEAIVASGDPKHIEDVFRFATDESRLKGGSLVAAGGWCAPSEILYDFFDEGASRDGLFSLPEIQVTRGGIQYTTGPSFADIYAATGFCFTEDDDIADPPRYAAGTNPGDPNVAGPKPCYHIECPEFQECRMDVCGLCITAGLLQMRGYPEILAATVAGALIAHDHKMSARLIQEVVAGSTPVVFPGPQAGATAPLLSAIEIQVEHYRYSHRLARTRTLEAVFPYWVRGAVRSDLSRRLGVELLSVTDAQINSWFTQRGVNPQFVYDWQALDTTAAGTFVQWPTTVQFLLYAAGTWVRGSSDVITLDTIYDSVNLSNNDFVALFTEEGWMVCKRGFDSRLITVPITPDGATAAGVDIAHNGTIVAGV